MADGTTKRICEVQVGDQVLSRDPATGKDEAKTVTATIERHAPSVVDVTLHDARTGHEGTLTCTPEHPLFVQGQGWVEAGSVGIGSSIVSRAGPALQVTDLTWEKNKAEELAAGTGSSFGGYTVYNLTVEDDHTFFVGSAGGGTWVHNTCRVRHFTNKSALSKIRQSLMLIASDKNKVFTVLKKGKPGSARDVEVELGITKGRGNAYVEFDAKDGEYAIVNNPTTGATEHVFDGSVDLSERNPGFHNNY